jgi:hypothetical protein
MTRVSPPVLTTDPALQNAKAGSTLAGLIVIGFAVRHKAAAKA